MGVAVSSQSALAPISFASTITGFISFAFTLATVIRVFWDSIATFFGAATEIDDMLTNLRQALYEERANLRRARQQVKRRRRSAAAKGEGLGGRREGLTPDDALGAMSNAVKDMIRAFKQVEKPFLVDGLDEPRRRRGDRESWADDAAGYSSGGIGEDEHADYLYARSRYRKCTIKQRFLWLRYKSKALGLLDAIMRIEVRRIGTSMACS
ncbi:hypothetical protein, variant 1 [Verruconis gallopava]|uniref:Uncharacterized protein n=1 Tax=Verruconis gallopava TaxID=253628 RepID=A0A0D2A8Y7_9PEZI|nr:hypothetical protein, variant 1 [Verruconis gallopava]KIW03228.1 hypothetical protein, variant 1 [Verruconis gallopava]